MYSFIYLWYGWIVVVRSPENSCYQLLSYGHLGMIHRRILRRFWSQQSMESAMLYVTCTRLGCCSPKITPSRSCCGWATWSSAVVWSHRFHGSRGPVSRNPHNHPESPYEDTDQVKNVHRKNTARIIRGHMNQQKRSYQQEINTGCAPGSQEDFAPTTCGLDHNSEVGISTHRDVDIHIDIYIYI